MTNDVETGSRPADVNPASRAHVDPRRRWVPLLLMAGIVVSQLAWMWGTPPFRAIDEIDHVFRSASVALGDVRPTQLPPEGRGALGRVPPGLAADAKGQCEALKYNGASNCTPTETLPDGNVLIASSAAPYSPVFYAVIGTLARPWDGVAALYVMRLACSLINALLLCAAAWCLLTRSRTGWPLTGLVVGLTPMAMYTSMVPAPNGLELSCAALLWCALLGLQTAQPRHHGRLLVSAAVAGTLLASIRLTGPIFIVLIVAFVALAAPRATLRVVRRRWQGVVAAAVVTLAGALYQLHWMNTHPPVATRDDGTTYRLGLILVQAPLWVFQWIGAFPYRDHPSSPVTYGACATALFFLFAAGLRRGDRRKWTALGVVAACIVLPLAYTFATIATKGTFWQGRYALPLLIGAPLLIGLSLDVADRHEGRLDRIAQQVMVGLVSIGSAAAVIHLVHVESHRAPSAADPHWHQPAAVSVIALAAVAGLCFSRAIAWAGTVPGSRRLLPDGPHPEYQPDDPDQHAEHGEGRRERRHPAQQPERHHR